MNIESSTKLALGAAACAAFLVLVLWLLGRLLYKAATGKEEATPTYRPFSNIITLTILMLCVGLIAIGLELIVFAQSFKGVWVGFIGALIWWAGDVCIQTKPRHAGALMLYGDYIKIGGKPVVVGGRTIILPYWPFNMTVQTFDMTTRDFEVPMVLYSKDKVPLPGKASLSMRPDADGIIEYNQAGGMDKIEPQAKDIVVRNVRHIGCNLTAEQIVMDPTALADIFDNILKNHIRDIFKAKSFGVRVVSVRPDFDFDDEMKERMKGRRMEMYERENELTEYETDYKAAKRLLDIHRETDRDTKVTLNDCLQEIKQLRLIRDEHMFFVGSSNKGGAVTIAELNVTHGGGGKKK